MSKSFRLTDAQQSALECAGLDEMFDEMFDDVDRVVSAAWQRPDRIVVAPDTQDALFSALNEMSNASDYVAREQKDVYARRASRSFQALASKVIRIGF